MRLKSYGNPISGRGVDPTGPGQPVGRIIGRGVCPPRGTPTADCARAAAAARRRDGRGRRTRRRTAEERRESRRWAHDTDGGRNRGRRWCGGAGQSRDLRTCMKSGTGILPVGSGGIGVPRSGRGQALPMIHGLEAHATLSRVFIHVLMDFFVFPKVSPDTVVDRETRLLLGGILAEEYPRALRQIIHADRIDGQRAMHFTAGLVRARPLANWRGRCHCGRCPD